MKIDPNKTISHYKILSEIGKGGMGEVYLAQDTELDRKVAIKFLSEEFSKDSDKLNRFIQEAKAVSALNHPNILTIHQIGESEGMRYLATEYIEGNTLREVISAKDTIPLNQILKIGIQTAEALSAAHQAGIAHRDIKPENIMVRKDGYVKVLDFGLAKLTERDTPEDELSFEGETKALVKTNPGVVMGTVSYMSPEQARGKETDERTDIWSLGVVLYEMLAGKVPFAGDTINHTIVAILETEPKLLENVPDELQRIIRKTLTKEKGMRYQTSGDLAIDLKNLRRDLDFQGELERSIIPNRDTEGVGAETLAPAEESAERSDTAAHSMSTQNLTSTSSLEYAVTQAKSHKLGAAAIALLLVGTIAAISYFAFFSGGGNDPIDSIAVMPFTVSGDGSETDYLADGLTESIIYNLSKLPQLKVLPNSTVLRYKGKQTSADIVGNELGVRAVLVSRIAQRGDNIEISTELIDTRENKVIWGERYSRKVSDALSIQNEISREISDRLRLKLTGNDQENLTKQYTADPEAYQEYLKGRYQFEKRTPEGIRKATEHYERAVALDPGYAKAWSGLANSYFVLPQYDGTPQVAAIPNAMSAARKAVELDPNLAEARTSLALVLMGDWHLSEAEAEFKKSQELDPKYATAHHWYGLLLVMKGQKAEAINELKTALELEPLSLIINRNLGVVLTFSQKFTEARDQIRKTMEMDPDFPLARAFIGVTYLFEEDYPKAIEELTKAVNGGDKSAESDLGVAYALSGNQVAARKILDKMRRSEPLAEVDVAQLYLALGDKEQAFKWLDRAVDSKSFFLLYIKIDPGFDAIRDDTRYKDLVRRIGLPE